MVSTKNLEVVEGDTSTINCTFTDSDGNAINVSTYSFFMTVKSGVNDTDANAVIKQEPADFSVSGAGNNIASTTISATDNTIDAGTYYYDIQYVTGADVVTVVKGIYKVVDQITVRTS